MPFSNLAAHRLCGVDLRPGRTGTISGTARYQVAGFGPLAVAGLLDVAKGAVGPLLVGRRRPAAAALGALVTQAGLVPVLAATRGRRGLLAGIAVLMPLLAQVYGTARGGGRQAAGWAGDRPEPGDLPGVRPAGQRDRPRRDRGPGRGHGPHRPALDELLSA